MDLEITKIITKSGVQHFANNCDFQDLIKDELIEIIDTLLGNIKCQEEYEGDGTITRKFKFDNF